MPVSTGIATICPDDFDFTSITLIGSTTPVASASTTIVCRVTGSTGIVSALSFFFEHASVAKAASASIVFLYKVLLLEIAADQRFELRLGHAVVVSGADECGARVVELSLRREKVEQCRGAELDSVAAALADLRPRPRPKLSEFAPAPVLCSSGRATAPVSDEREASRREDATSATSSATIARATFTSRFRLLNSGKFRLKLRL